MDWRLKALIQNAISALPSRISYPAYYSIQRKFGGLRCANPLPAIRSATEIAATILEHDRRIEHSSFLEVGTGRTLSLPITMWLLGADRVTTVDLNPYLKFELVADDLHFIRTHETEVIQYLKPFGLNMRRLHRLLEFDPEAGCLSELLAMCHIEYLAPLDACSLSLADGAVTFHVSSNVCEHIPSGSLAKILKEAARVLAGDGLCVHRIDHSDHFAHSEPGLSPVNFLQYSEMQWALLAGNKFMYMNRLQVDDIQSLFEQNDLDVLSVQAVIDTGALKHLVNGRVRPHARFTGKPLETLATLRSIFVGRRRSNVPQVA